MRYGAGAMLMLATLASKARGVVSEDCACANLMVKRKAYAHAAEYSVNGLRLG
jgi:hypothetical protein